MAGQTATQRRTKAAVEPAPSIRAKREIPGPNQSRLADVGRSLNAAAAVQRVRQFAAQADAQAAAKAAAKTPNDIGLPDVLKQGRLRPTMQLTAGRLKAGAPVNDEASLEHEATVMGARALSEPAQRATARPTVPAAARGDPPVQRLRAANGKQVKISELTPKELKGLGRALSLGALPTTEVSIANFLVSTTDGPKILKAYKNQFPKDKPKTFKIGDFKESEYDEEADSDYEPNSEEEMVSYLMTDGRYLAGLDKISNQRGEERVLAPWSERSLQGTIGEYQARKNLEKKGEKTGDLNKMQHNFPGLDNISNHPTYPFEQTKLHLSESTATPETYSRHLKTAPKYAINAVRGLIRNNKEFKNLIETKEFKKNKVLRNAYNALEEIGDPKNDDEIDGSTAHKLISDGLRFSVPSDIHENMPEEDKDRFIDIGKPVEYFQNVMKFMTGDFKSPSPYGSKKVDDSEVDFLPESDEEGNHKRKRGDQSESKKKKKEKK